MRQINIAVLFDSFGPYHVARLNFAAKFGKIIGIELFAKTDNYIFGNSNDRINFNRITLFQSSGRNSEPFREVKKKLLQCLSSINPDVIAVPGWGDPYALLAIEWALKNSKPIIMMSDSNKKDSKRNRIQEYVKRIIISNCNSAFVAGTLQREYINELGISWNKIFLGYDVIDNNYFQNNTQSIRHSLVKSNPNLPDKYFLCCARFIPEKNLINLIFAYNRYIRIAKDSQSENSVWKLVLVGDGPLRSLIESKVKEFNIGEFIYFTGNRKYHELPEFYAYAKALILPSKKDTWGLVINEAMASGLPVLVSINCGCLNDLVVNEKNGYSFDPSDVEGIAQILLKTSNKPEEKLIKMGDQSKEIIKLWGLDRFSNGLWQAAEDALSSKLPPRRFINLIIIKFIRFFINHPK